MMCRSPNEAEIAARIKDKYDDLYECASCGEMKFQLELAFADKDVVICEECFDA